MIGSISQAMDFNAEALRLRSQRQQVLASNLANADTPNYKAVDFDFSQALRMATRMPAAAGAGPAEAGALALARTSARHLGNGGALNLPTALQYRMPAQGSLDGNTVETDRERTEFADNAVRYETALRMLGGQVRTLLSAATGQ